MNPVRADFLLVISFGVVSVILIVAGLISLLEEFDRGLSALLIVFGIGFILATIMTCARIGIHGEVVGFIGWLGFFCLTVLCIKDFIPKYNVKTSAKSVVKASNTPKLLFH